MSDLVWVRTGKITVLLAALVGAGCSDVGGEPIGVEQQGLARACGANCSKWVFPSVFSRDLIYVPDLEGDQIPDPSRVGYQSGATGLLSEQLPPQGSDNPIDISPAGWQALLQALGGFFPLESSVPPPTGTTAPTNICTPGAFDHGVVIQRLIDQVALRPGPNRGRVYLPRGHYAVHHQLELKDGVILRGVSAYGPGAPTTLHLCGHEGRLIDSNGGDVGTLVDAPREILDDVPSGANSVRVGLNSGFEVGRMVQIIRTPCASVDRTAAGLAANCPKLWQWTQDMGMDETWNPSQIEFQRHITHIQPVEDQLGNIVGSRVFLDLPLTNALESKYGPHTIQQYASNDRPTGVYNMGVMKLRGVSHLTDACDTEANCTKQNMIWFNASVDSWIYQVVAEGFSMSAVTLGTRSRFNTVEDVKYINPQGIITGGWRYPFFNKGQMNLIARVYSSDARHDQIPDGWVPGPNVVLESSADNSIQDSGTHQRWSTGTLYDNLQLLSIPPPPNVAAAGRIEVRNRTDAGESGSQGWSGGNIVAWNTYAIGGYEFYNPPTAQNWLIGNTGGPVGTTLQTNGSPAHGDTFNGQHAGSLFNTLGGTPPDPTIGASLYRTSTYVYGPASLGNDEVEVRQYFVGDIDDFTSESNDTVNDSVFVDPPFATWLGTTAAAPYPIKGFDYTLTNTNTSAAVNVPVSIRYDLATDQTVTMAYLAMRIRRVGSWTSDADHFLQIAGVGTQNSDFANAKTYYWQCGSGTPTNCEVIPPDLTGPIGWSTTAGSSGPPGTSVVRVLELPDSIFHDILNKTRTTTAGRRFGELNLNFAKKTRIDWLRLALVVRRSIPG